jgi:MFS family permease
MALSGGFRSITRTLGQRNFRIYLVGSSVSLIGTWMARIAVGWLTWELTKSYTWLGLMGFAELFPAVIAAPIFGAIADRTDRKWMAIIAQIAACAHAVALAGLVLADLINVWLLLGLNFLIGIAYSAASTARLALFPVIIERAYISSAIAINAAAMNLARFLGPAVAGVIIATWDVGAAFAINAVTFLWFIVALSRLVVLRSETAARESRGFFHDVVEGCAYALRHPGIGPALLILVACAFGIKGFPDLLPGFADNVFARGVTGFAQLTAATGIGAAVAALWVAQRGRMEGLTGVSLLYLLIAVIAVVVFVATDIFAVALIGVFLIGAAVTVVGTTTQSLMQNAVDGAMRGRVMSLFGLIFRGGPAIGALAMGALAELIGLRIAVAGAAMIAVVALVWLVPRRHAIARALERDPDKAGGA